MKLFICAVLLLAVCSAQGLFLSHTKYQTFLEIKILKMNTKIIYFLIN